MLRPLLLLLTLSFTATTRVAANGGGGDLPVTLPILHAAQRSALGTSHAQLGHPHLVRRQGGKMNGAAAYCHAALNKSPQNEEIDKLTIAYRQLLVVVSRLGKPAETTFPDFPDGMPGRLTENEILRALRGYIGRASAATKLGGLDEKLGKLGKAAIVAKGTWLTVRLRWLDTRIRGWALLKSPSKWAGAAKSAWQGVSNWVALKWAWVRGKRAMGNQHIDEADKLAGDMAGAWGEQQPDACMMPPPQQQQQGAPQYMPQGTPQYMPPQQGMQQPQWQPMQQQGMPQGMQQPQWQFAQQGGGGNGANGQW